jgi:hypothetical protein
MNLKLADVDPNHRGYAQNEREGGNAKDGRMLGSGDAGGKRSVHMRRAQSACPGDSTQTLKHWQY